jgi:hypothetical protein
MVTTLEDVVWQLDDEPADVDWNEPNVLVDPTLPALCMIERMPVKRVTPPQRPTLEMILAYLKQEAAGPR